ncbi:glycosyltransferase family 31 protein [Podospora conica]|nr:glycosyltransferase family 31 protein [Schizothecium conicum]
MARCRKALQKANFARRFCRRMPILIGLFLGVLLWTAARLHNGSPIIPASIMRLGHKEAPPPPPPPPDPLPGTDRPSWKPGMCNIPEIEFLRSSKLGLTSSIVYTRRCVKPTRSASTNRDEIANITAPLISSKTTVNLTDCSAVELPPCEPLHLTVPLPFPTKQYPHLLFGIASNYERIVAGLPEFAHWLSDTGAQLIGIVADADDVRNPQYNLTTLTALYAARNITATFLPPTLKTRINGEGPPPIEHHHFLLVQTLHDHLTPATRWLGILDDDTFFPALAPLDAALAAHDHTQSTWLGALSDDFGSVRTWGMMAFGGAGIFVSPPLAAAVAARSDACLRNQPTATGDGLLRDCIYAYTRTQLTLVPGLHQMDMRGDPSGFFEGGLRPLPLSLHHWKSWFRAPVAAMARVATLVCGGCMLQRWRVGGDTVFTNGWSVAVYDTLEGIDLDRVEGTWAHPTREFDPTYGMLRERVPRERKRSYLLREAVEDTVDGKRVLRQVYVYRPEEGWEDKTRAWEGDEVVEMFWEI